MFSTESNAAFNNRTFSQRTIGAMHETMSRLSTAALEMNGAIGPAQIARLLGESEQTLTNWAKRGVSIPGAVKAERLIGCPAIWVLYGEGSPPQTPDKKMRHTYTASSTSIAAHTARDQRYAWPFARITESDWKRLTPDQRQAAELLVAAYITGLGSNNGNTAAA